MQTALTNEKILKFAPSAATKQPQGHLSDKYSFISTLDVVDLLRDEGWYPSYARQSRVNKKENDGYQKHLIRMRHPNHTQGNEYLEIVIVNSHNGRSSYQFMIGIFRLVCTNGLFVGDTFDKIKVKHIGITKDDVIDASYKVLEVAPKIAGAIDTMKSIELQHEERRAYAWGTLQLLYDEPQKEAPISGLDLLKPRRHADNKGDLWTTFNVVQENIVRGGISGRSKKTGRRITTQPVKAIDRDVRLNRALWTLTEKMAELKA